MRARVLTHSFRAAFCSRVAGSGDPHDHLGERDAQQIVMDFGVDLAQRGDDPLEFALAADKPPSVVIDKELGDRVLSRHMTWIDGGK